MHARLTTYKGKVEDYDRGLDKLRHDVAPQVRAMSGCKGLLTMVDRSTGQSLSITLWDSEEELANSREDANRVRSQAAGTLGSKVADVTEYEVGMWELT